MPKGPICNLLTKEMEKQAADLSASFGTKIYPAAILAAHNHYNSIGKSEPDAAEIKAYVQKMLENRKQEKNIEQFFTEGSRTSELVNIAPYRDASFAKGNLSDEEFQKKYEKDKAAFRGAADSIAGLLGLEIKSFRDNTGFWQDGSEPSFAIEFDEKQKNEKADQIALFTSLMADLGHETQNSALIVRYDDISADDDSADVSDEYSISFGKLPAEIRSGLLAITNRFLAENSGVGFGYSYDEDSGELRFVVGRQAYSADNSENTQYSAERTFLGNWVNLSTQLINYLAENHVEATSKSTPVHATFLGGSERGNLYEEWLEGSHKKDLSGSLRQLILQARRRADQRFVEETTKNLIEAYASEANPVNAPLSEEELRELNLKYAQKFLDAENKVGKRLLCRLTYGTKDGIHYIKSSPVRNLATDLDVDKAQAQLRQTFSRKTLNARVDMLAREMHHSLGSLAETQLAEYTSLRDGIYQKASDENRVLTFGERMRAAEFDRKIFVLSDWENNISSAVNIISLEGIATETLRRVIYDQMAADEKDSEKYQQIIDNFELLRPLVLQRFANLEAIELGRELSQEESEDEGGNYASGNDGWGIEAHTRDSYLGISGTVRHALANCVIYRKLEDGSITVVTDDMGYPKYMDPKEAYQRIHENLCNMTEESDFYDTVAEPLYGTPYKALAKMRDIPGNEWVSDVIAYLEDYPEAAPLFYNAFNEDHVKSLKFSEGKFGVANALGSGEALFNDAEMAYERGLTDEDSIWDASGALQSADNIASKIDGCDKLINRINKDGALTPEQMDEATNLMTSLLRAIGVNVDSAFSRAKLEQLADSKAKADLLFMAKSLKKILLAARNASSRNFDILSGARQRYIDIGSALGYSNGVSITNSYYGPNRKMYYSYRKPNKVSATVKALASGDVNKRKAFIERTFEPDYAYYDAYNNTWGCPTIAALYNGDEELAENMELASLTYFNRHTYKQMTSAECYLADVYAFFSTAGNNPNARWFSYYHIPPYSNAPTTDYIKLERFHGSREHYQGEIKQLMSRVVKQELKRIRIGELRKERVANGELKQIARWDSNSTQFCTIPFFNKADSSGRTIMDVLKQSKGNYDAVEIDQYIDSRLDEYFAGAVANILRDFPLMDNSFLYYIAKENGYLTDKGALKEAFSKAIRKPQDVQDSQEVWIRQEVEKAIASPASAINPVIGALADAVVNYTWNQHYALSQIVQLTTADLAPYKQNDLGVDWVKRFKGVHASGESMYTGSQYGKTNSVLINLQDSHYVSTNYASIAADVKHALDSKNISKELADFILDAYADLNVTDGQSYRTLDSMRSVLDMRGLWHSETMDPAFDRIKAGQFSMEDLEVVFGAVKPFIEQTVLTQTGVTYGDVHPSLVENGDPRADMPISIGIETQYKDSEAVLMAMLPYVQKALGQTATSSKLRGLQRFMEDYNIDIAKFESAGKVGQQGTINLNYSPSWWESLSEDDKAEIEAAFSAKNSGAAPTEADRPEMADIFKGILAKNLQAGRISQAQFNEEIDRMEPTEQEIYDALREACFYGNKPVPHGIVPISNPNAPSITDMNPEVVKVIDNSYYRIVQPTKEHLFDSEVVLGVQFKNLITADLPEDLSISVGAFRNSKHKSFQGSDIKKQFNALLTENLIEDFRKLSKTFSNIEEFHAALMAQLRNSPDISEDIVSAVSLQTVKDAAGAEYTTFRTPFSDPAVATKLSQIVLSMFKNRIAKQKMFGGAAVIETGWDFMANYNGTHLGRVTDAEGNLLGYECLLPAWSKKFFTKYLREDGSYDYTQMSKEHPELMKMIGYRIPTDHKHSMVPLIVKGFLPHGKSNTIIISEDAVAAAGEDKDIDKKYLIMPKFHVKGLEARRNEFKKAYLLEMKSRGSIYADRLNMDDVDIAIDMLINGQVEAMDDSAAKSVLNFYLENTDTFGVPEIEKTAYDPAFEPKQMSRDQRDNMMFDMAYQILLQKDIQYQALTPTNFETVRYIGDLMQVAESEAGKVTAENKSSIQSVMPLAKSLLNTSRSEARAKSKDLDAKAEYDPLSPLNTYRHHKANMDALDLVAVFAANSTVNAKYQGTAMDLMENRQFKVNGVLLTNMAALRDTDGTLVSQHFSEFINAATDNGKDPTIGKFGVTLGNANTVCAGLALGLTPKTIALFLKQKFNNSTKAATGELLYKLGYGERPSDADILKDGITDEELLSAIILYPKYEELMQRYKRLGKSTIDSNPIPGESESFSDADLDVIRLFLKASVFKDNLNKCTEQYKLRTKISRADGTAGAVAHTIGGAIVQMRKVDKYSFQTNQKRVLKTSKASPVNIDESLLSGDLTADVEAQLREIFNNSGLPVTQAAHALGVQATKALMGRYFPQFSNETVEIVNRILDNCKPAADDDDEIWQANRVISAMTTYALAGTDLFGDDGEHTMAEKRDYYVYQFPKDFENILKYNREIKSLYFFDSIRNVDGTLVLKNSGKMTQKDAIQISTDLDALLLGEIMPKTVIKDGKEVPITPYMKSIKKSIYNRLAKDILMYSYYTGQLTFGATTIGNRFSDTFKHAFPEYIEALRNIPNNFKSEEQTSRFIDQLFATETLPMKSIVYDSRYATGDSDSSLRIPLEKCANNMGTLPASHLLALEETIEDTVRNVTVHRLKLVKTESTSTVDDKGNISVNVYGVYVPLNKLDTRDGVKFNPNWDFEDLSSYKFDSERWDKFVADSKKGKGTRYSTEVMLANSEAADIAASTENFDFEAAASLFDVPGYNFVEAPANSSTVNSENTQIVGKNISSNGSNWKYTGVTKIISGGQTGVDTIGLQVGRRLGIETGGKAPRGFLREGGYDTESIASYGLVEITPAEQEDYTKRTGRSDPYTGRTELNVRNSDGTVYFTNDPDSRGLRATQRAAEEFNKPFIVNPSTNTLSAWLKDNNISVLNVAGNRGSKLPKDNKVAKILEDAISSYRSTVGPSPVTNSQEIVTVSADELGLNPDEMGDFYIPAASEDLSNSGDSTPTTSDVMNSLPNVDMSMLEAIEAAADANQSESYPSGPNNIITEERC